MRFKNSNLQIDSKVKTCKDCIDEETLYSICDCTVSFYVFLVAIPVSSVFIFKAFYKINICGKIPVGGLVIACLIVAFIIFFVTFYLKTKNIKCKEICYDLKSNYNYMVLSAILELICYVISTWSYPNIETTVSITLLLVTCFIGFRAKYYNNEYALTKINMDYTNTMNSYSKIREYETEIKLLTKRKSHLKYYKVMETNYLMLSALFVFVTSVLGKFC